LDQISKVEDYYIDYNRADGINEDTREDRDKVTIVFKGAGGPGEYGRSWKTTSLMPGEQHVIEKFNGQSDVTVQFIKVDNGDATIRVIADGTISPTPSPSSVTCEDQAKDTFHRKYSRK
jgi:hypothetical protein